MKLSVQAIIFSPYRLLRWILTGNSKSDWISASSTFLIMVLLPGLGLLNLQNGNREWIGAVVEHISWWPLWELMALVFTPVLMWWLDPDDGLLVRYRILISVAVFSVWYLVLSPSNHLLIVYLGIFLLARLSPMLFQPRPTADDRGKELIKLSVIILFVIFILLPAYIAFSMICRNVGIDLDENERTIFLIVSAIYFFVVASLDMKLNAYRSMRLMS